MKPSRAAMIAFKRRLLSWYRKQARDLPWRRTRDPYRILVSEFMLQQTQVSRVQQYYGKFLARYPTLRALSRARPSAVREMWEGLGYYRRAENLHRLAQTVMDRHAGVVPSDPGVLVTLPGVGKYTAGAVATFAYERRAAAVDTNVARVVSRVFGMGKREEGRGKSTAVVKQIWTLTTQLLPKEGRTVWEFNQALMDLGATVCVARSPKCEICPVRVGCRGRRSPR